MSLACFTTVTETTPPTTLEELEACNQRLKQSLLPLGPEECEFYYNRLIAYFDLVLTSRILLKGKHETKA